VDDHIHTGFVTVAFVTVAAIVGINVVRFVAAQLATRDATAKLGKALGATVTFGG
jgi:hypothetical protein